MLRIHTTQYGDLGLAFHHKTGDPNGELLRALRRANAGDKEAIEKDRQIVDKLLAAGLKIYVDTSARQTVAQIKLNAPVTIPNPDASGTLELHEVSGTAHVHPTDTYVKESGRLTALERAIEQLPGVTEKTRREILSGYFSR